jgi:hypothetical protein
VGHERVGALPHTKCRQRIVSQIAESSNLSASVPEIAQATPENVRKQFNGIHKDRGVRAAFSFLVALSTSGSTDAVPADSSLPAIDLAANPSPLRLAAALREWVNGHCQSLEYAEIAQKSASDAIAFWTQQQKQQPSLFDKANDTAEIWRKANSGAGFCEVARVFFAKFTERYLNYFLARVASASSSTLSEREAFAAGMETYVDAVSKHAFETPKITQSFAAGWFNKHARRRAVSDGDVESFLRIGFGKIREELQREVSEP